MTKASETKVQTRAGEVEEIVELWKLEKEMEDYSTNNAKTEAELLKELLEPLCLPWDDPENYEMAEWNGHNHQPVPDSQPLRS